MSDHLIDNTTLTIDKIASLIQSKTRLILSDEAKGAINKCRTYLEDKLTNHDQPIYGVNTGFGSLCNKSIPKSDLEKLQENLVVSHACGMGDKVPTEIVKLMLLFKIQSFSKGHSGVSLELVDRLVDMYNNDVLPVIYEQGSLGASGDLAPLAHFSLPLIAKGEVYYKGEIKNSDKVLNELGWGKLILKPKEGIALLNGTQFMSAYGTFCLAKAKRLSKQTDIIASISIDAFDCRKEPFSDLLHKIRPFNGQIETAKNISSYLEGSEITSQNKDHVQDPYSFRCIPQVHGAVKDAINYVESVFTTEVNAVSDNPLVFPDEDQIISGGNFHGEPLALALDFFAISLSELGSISERRTYKLVSGERGLPTFLIEDSGINSGLMIPQYTAAAITSENKQLSTPASVDSIVSSNGQEDHVSMGANAAVKALRVVNNVERILAIELLNAVQAIEFRKPLKTSQKLEEVISSFRKTVPTLQADRYLKEDMDKAVEFLQKL
ncbi:MAG: histidine ammonia-lyase [Bacteroidetes bacterium]|nr:MAG: histidine ammonia-lyase [Bacteroidota bacterium]